MSAKEKEPHEDQSFVVVSTPAAVSLPESPAEPPEQEIAADGSAVGDAAVPAAPDANAMVQPLLAQVQAWSQQLSPLVTASQVAAGKVVAPVAAVLQQWAKNLEPLVAQGGEHVRRAVAPVQEALAQLLAKLEPHTAPATAAIQSGVTTAVEAIRSFMEKLAPLSDELRQKTVAAAAAVQPWMATTGAALKASSAAALENAKEHGAAAAKAVGEWNATQLQPWAAQTGDVIKTHASVAAGHMQQWHATQLEPWISERVAPLATEWWLETLRCFCVPIAGMVALAGLKEPAAKLYALAPEKLAAEGAYPTAANPPPTEPAAVAAA